MSLENGLTFSQGERADRKQLLSLCREKRKHADNGISWNCAHACVPVCVCLGFVGVGG